MSYPSTDSKMFLPSRPSQMISTPTNMSHYTSVPKTFNVKELPETKSTDNRFAFMPNKKPSIETASNISSNSTTSTISNMTTIKPDFVAKEKNYQNTIEKLQKKIESLSTENKKLSDNINIRSSCILNKSLDDKDQPQNHDQAQPYEKTQFYGQSQSNGQPQILVQLQANGQVQLNSNGKTQGLNHGEERNQGLTSTHYGVDQNHLYVIQNEKEQLERTYQRKIEKLMEENLNLSSEVTSKSTEINVLEKKLAFLSIEEEKNDGNEIIKKVKLENEGLMMRLAEKDKKYEELEEIYKQKLSQFKKEISTIKNQQKESSLKELNDIISVLKDRIKDLEEALKKKNEEIQELSNKLHRKSNISISNMHDSELKTPTSRDFKPNHSKVQSTKGSEYSSINTNRLGQGLVKCNWEELEKKITSLVDENDKLVENYAHNTESISWKQKYMDLEGKLMGKDDVYKDFSLMKKENDDLKRNLSNLSMDNTNILEKLAALEKKFENSSKENLEDYIKKEEDLKMSFEVTLQGLEEQKEKNLMKISKENHELKQHNDELKQQIEVLQKQKLNSNSHQNINSITTNISNNNNTSNTNNTNNMPIINIIENQQVPTKKTTEKQPLAQNSSPILIINEMLTPSTKNLLDKTNKDSNKHSNNLQAVTESKEENLFSFTKNKKISNENIKKNYFNNNPIGVQQPETVKISMNKTHNSRESQEFPNKYLTKNYGVVNNGGNLKENNNNSKEMSFKENNLKESNISFKDVMNESAKNEINNKPNENKFDFLAHNKTDFKQGGNYLQTVRSELPMKKETKIISFNLSDNNKTAVTNSNVSARYTKV